MSGFTHDVSLTEHMFLLLGLHYVLIIKIFMTMKIDHGDDDDENTTLFCCQTLEYGTFCRGNLVSAL